MGGRPCTVVDLSRRLSNATSEFEPNPHKIDYVSHEEAAQAIGVKLGGVDLWREERSGAAEAVELTTHSGTHIDAPYHYWPTSEGRPARKIDDVPLRWCIGDGVLLDFSHKEPGDGIDADEVDAALAAIDHELRPGEIVLVRTDSSRHFEEPGYHTRQPGLRRSATELLVEAGVKMIGIDAWGLDRPFDVMVAESRAGDPDQFWESHYFGMEREYCQIEQLCNLDQIPAADGFTVIALPVLLADASASWSRVVAIVPDPPGAG
ncbi:MAG: cyclase family protein [Solirubrobacterales bacterium]